MTEITVFSLFYVFVAVPGFQGKQKKWSFAYVFLSFAKLVSDFS